MSRSSSNSGDNNTNNNNDAGRDESLIEYDTESSEEECEEWEELAEVDRALFTAVIDNDDAGVQLTLRIGANVNCSIVSRTGSTPLLKACSKGYDPIVRILLDAGADARWQDDEGKSAIQSAALKGHLSTVEMLLNHDKGLLEIEDSIGWTPLLFAIERRKVRIVRFLLDRGANALAATDDGSTTLLLACDNGADLAIVRRLLAAGVAVEALDNMQDTALHHAARRCSLEVLRELIVEHNANMFAADNFGETPFDFALSSYPAGLRCTFLIECYSNKLTQEHGRLALHAVLGAAEYSFAENYKFHPPENPLRIHLPLGKLTLNNFRILLSTLDVELIRNRDERGMLPIHIACQSNAPVEVLSMLTEMDPTTLQISNDSGALPIHSLCGSGTPADYASVQYLVEQGGVGTLAARNLDGAMPLHVFCGSTNPSLRTVQYLIQSVPTSVTVQTNAGQYPFMLAASDTSDASLSIVYAVVWANPTVL